MAAAGAQPPANPPAPGAGGDAPPQDRTLEQLLELDLADFPSMEEVDALAADLLRLNVNPFRGGFAQDKFRSMLFAAVSRAEDLQAAGSAVGDDTARILNRMTKHVPQLALDPLVPGGKPTSGAAISAQGAEMDVSKLPKRAKYFALAFKAGNFRKTLTDPLQAPSYAQGTGTKQTDVTPAAATLFCRLVWTPEDLSSADPETFLKRQMAEYTECEDESVRLLMALRSFRKHFPRLVPTTHREDCGCFWEGLETFVVHILGRGGTLAHAIESVEALLVALRQRMLGTYTATPQQELSALGNLVHQAEGADIWLHEQSVKDIWSPTIYDGSPHESPWGALMLSPRIHRIATQALVAASASAAKPGRHAVSTPNPSSAARQLMVSCNLPPNWVKLVYRHWCPLDVALPGSCPGARSGACPCKHMASASDARLVVEAVAKANVLHPNSWYSYLANLEAQMPLVTDLRQAVGEACKSKGKGSAPAQR